MEWTFTRVSGRGIDVDLGSSWPGFNEALADSVSSMSPRSSWRRGLSTYWIDHVLDGVATGRTDGKALSSGNSTELVLEGDDVVARSLYELFGDERMELKEYTELLQAWRAQVVEHRREFRIGRAYRRNGF
jgi:hypothetical protein